MRDKGDAVKGNVLQNDQNKFKNVRHYKNTINVNLQQLFNLVILNKKTFRNNKMRRFWATLKQLKR